GGGGGSRRSEVEAACRSVPAAGEEDDVRSQLLAGPEQRLGSAPASPHQLHLLAEPEDKPEPAKVVLERLDQLVVEAEQPRLRVDDRHVDAERDGNGCKLEPDHAAADNGEPLREIREPQDPLGVEDRSVVEVDPCGTVGCCADGDHDPLRTDPVWRGTFANLERVRTDEGGRPLEDPDAAPPELVSDRTLLMLDDLLRSPQQVVDRDL